MKDKMPEWLLIDYTDEELMEFYKNMPFVKNAFTFEEFKEEWLIQRGVNL
jgi:hypothetical protein